MISCLIFEILIKKYIFREHTLVSDCSALLTGLLLAFNLPSNLPVWIVILGSFIASRGSQDDFWWIREESF